MEWIHDIIRRLHFLSDCAVMFDNTTHPESAGVFAEMLDAIAGELSDATQSITADEDKSIITFEEER
jgi:hypothetical protein